MVSVVAVRRHCLIVDCIVKTIVGWILHVQVLKFAFIILNPEFANVCFSCLNPQNPGCQAVFFPSLDVVSVAVARRLAGCNGPKKVVVVCRRGVNPTKSQGLGAT